MTEQNTNPELQTPYSPLQYDPERFREHVSEMGLSVEQQNALLKAVWLIIVGVADLSLGIHYQGDGDSKPMALDSSSVLTFLSTPMLTNTEDAKAEPNARRIDS